MKTLRILLFLSFVSCFSWTPSTSAQTTALTINTSSSLINVPSGVTPNFAALKVGGVSLALPAGAIVGTTDSQVLTNKTYNGLTIVGNGGSLTVASGKYLVVFSQLNLNGNDGSTVSFGAGGTVAYTTGSYADPAWITSLAPSKVLPSQTGNAGKVLQTDGSNLSWQTAGSGSGTVTSVGFSAFSGINVSGQPIVNSGTIALSTTLNGILKGTGSAFITATAGTDYQVPLTFSTGLTNTTNTITVNAINLAAGGSGGVTGTLPLANGGTGQTSLSALCSSLGISANIVVLSTQVTLNSNIDSGGGTDVTSGIQTILNTASASTPLWLVWDGVALTSSTLVVKSHTCIDAMPHCGFYLANGSNCQALTNQLNGSSIANTDLEIRNLEINGNGNNQAKWEGNTDLHTTTAGSGVTHGTTTIDFTPNTTVAPGMQVTVPSGSGSGDIPAGTYVASVTSGHAVLTQAATGSHTGVTFNFAFDSAYDRVIGWNYGLWFSGFQRLKLSGVTVRNAKTFSIVLSNGSDFVIEHCKSLWDDNDGHTLTNNNRDGIHMLGNLDTGHIVDYYTNGDDDGLAFNTDEGSLVGDSRRGSGYAISNIVAENIQYDASTNGVRFFGDCGTGAISNITIRNTHGTLIQGQQSCAPSTVADTTYLGRTGTDQALASIKQINIEGWDHTVVSPAVTDLTLAGVNKLRLANIPETTKITLTGVEDYTGDRAPTWQRYSLAPNSWDGSSASGGSFNGGVAGSFGHLELWSGSATGNYAAVTFGQMFSDPWPQAGSQNTYGEIDWTVPFEAECAFQLVSPADSTTIFRWLIGRSNTDVSTGSISSWFNGIGISVENQELFLVTAVLGTHYHLDTGYSVPFDKLTRVKLRSIGNGIVRVYVEGTDAVDTLVYSCSASQGPTGDTGPNHVEFHTTQTASNRCYVIISGQRYKR